MKRMLGALLASLVLLGGCLTTDYNLRTIVDTDRRYEGALSDSVSTQMQWNTPEWKAENVKYWRSAGVIITTSYNAFFENSWLKDIYDDGFEGTVFVEDGNMDLLQLAYGNVAPWNSRVPNFQNDQYNAKTPLFMSSNVVVGYPTPIPYSFTDANIMPFESTANLIIKPTAWTNTAFRTAYVKAWNDAFERASTYIGNTDDKVKWGVLLPDYSYDEWHKISYTDADSTAFTIDGVKPWSQNTDGEKGAIVRAEQSAKLDMFADAHIPVIVRGDRFTTEMENNSDLITRRITGYLFEDVNPSNIAQIESDVATIRNALPVTEEENALLLIAGVKKDVYHETSPTAYAQLIQRLVNAGMYFTPGADADHWNMPMTNPGDWWIRVNDDIIWQAQAPTYANASVSPRKMLGAVEVAPYDLPSAPIGLGGGGWLESGAFHPTNPNKIMLGADVVNSYYSEDRGYTFTQVNKGMISREDKHQFFTMETIGIDNAEFSGFLQANTGGIWSFAIDQADTFTHMTPNTSSSGMYIAEKDRDWGNWVEPIPFCDLSAASGDEYIVASAGKWRYLNADDYEDNHYPENYVTVNYANPVGRQGLWYYNYTENETTRKWRPIEWTTYDAWAKHSDHGIYRAVDVSIAGTDTLILAASSKMGPQLFNVTNRRWVDLASYPWVRYDGSDVTPTWVQVPDDAVNGQTIASVYLTDRMTAYVALQNLSQDWEGTSGIYRMHNVLYPTSWEWIGDQTIMPYNRDWDSSVPREPTHFPFDRYAAGDGNDIYGSWTYVSVAEGTAAAPDTVFGAERQTGLNLARAIVPYGYGTGYDQEQTWVPMEWMDSFNWIATRQPTASYPVNGYNEKNAWSGIMFEPMINPKNSNEVIIQDNVFLTHTRDGGSTWATLEPRKEPDDYTLNQTGGYIETCTNDIAVLSDGRLVVSNGDVGLAVSTSSTDWDRVHNLNMEVATYVSSSLDVHNECDSDMAGTTASYTTYGYPTAGMNSDLAITSFETSAIHVEPNWEGTGRDALFYSTGKRIGEQALSNILMWHDSNGDGTWETTSVTPHIPANTRWMYGYFYDFAWTRSGNNVTFYAPYKDAVVSACYTDPDITVSRWDDFGVHKFSYDSGTNTWTRTPFNNFSNYAWGVDSPSTHSPIGNPMTAYDIEYVSTVNKLYLALGAYGSTEYSGLYECDLDDVTPTWRKIMGANSYSGAQPADNRGYATDVQSLAVSADGTVLYVGTRGEQIGWAGVWKLTNLDNDMSVWELPTIEHVLNNAAKTTAWLPMPPSRYGEITIDHARMPGQSGIVLGEASRKDTRAPAMLVDPENKDNLWLTVRTRNPMHTDNGLWAFDTANNKLTQVISPAEDSRAAYMDENLYYDTTHTPHRIVAGTDCVGVFYINYDGMFHTDKEAATQPLPGAYVTAEYAPNGVYTINGSNEVKVFWNPTPNWTQNGLTGYNIYRSTTLNGTYTKLNVSVYNPTWTSTTPFIYQDLTAVNGNTYYYKVKSAYGGNESAYSEAVKGSPRLNYMNVVSTEDIWGDNGTTAWTRDANTTKIETANPFTPVGSPTNPPYNNTSAQGGVTAAGGVAGLQFFTPVGTPNVAQNMNWVLVSGYFKSSETNGIPHTPHNSTFRLYNRSTPGNVGYCEWTWLTDPSVITFISSYGSGATQPDARGSYYVGNGWHRVWFKVNLNARGIKTMNYTTQFTYNTTATVGYGGYMWGVMTEFSDTEPTVICDYVPVRPINYALPILPRYEGTENCVTLVPLVPAAPTSLTVSDYRSGEIDLTWNTDATADYYNVLRGATASQIGDFTTSEDNTFTDKVALNYTPYYYKTQTVNGDGVAGALSSNTHGYANEWLHGTAGCDEGISRVLNPPDFGSVAVAADSGMVDFSFVYEENTATYHVIGIDGQLLNWPGYNNTTLPNATQFVHYTSTDLKTWVRRPNIPLYDATYAKTNVWAPHIIKYGSTWYMFYTGVDNTQPGGTAYHLERIMVSTSTDLYTWSAGTVVLEGNDFEDGVLDFTEWNTTQDGTWRNDCRDAYVRRNTANNGWTMYTGVKSDETALGLTGERMMISLARSLDANYGGNPALSLVGAYKQYDYLIQTRNSGTGYCESPQLTTEPNGYTYIFWVTNDPAVGNVWMRTTAPDYGTIWGNTWSTATRAYDKKAIELLHLNTGEYISSYLESQTWDNEYFHIKFERILIYPTGVIKTSNIITPDCFNGPTSPWYTN